MASVVIKNWDNKTWLSSKNYINSFNKFLIKNLKINSKAKILDIGCGRGKILGSLSSKLRLKKKLAFAYTFSFFRKRYFFKF